MTGFWAAWGWSALAVVVLMAGTFAVGKATERYSVIDAVWGPGFALIAWVSFATTAGHGEQPLRLLVAIMTTLWGLRLGVHIAVRNHGRPEDPRYVAMLAGATSRHVIGKVHLPQALIMLVVSAPVVMAMVLTDPQWWLVVVGVVVWAIGLVFETVGDAQLSAFRKRRRGEDDVLDTGLWRYTRHPNYFGDACVWWGLWLCVAWTWAGAATVFAPALMTYLLVAKTGKALTESRMLDNRPRYADYLRRTSGFFPLPPKAAGR